jgi:polyphenol oxidase
MLNPVTAPSLSALPGLRHAFFTREGGQSQGLYASLNGGQGSGDDQGAVTENRRRMAAHLNVEPARFLSVWQVHSPDVAEVSGPWAESPWAESPWNCERPKADALVTRTPGLALAIATADCGPILFVDPAARVIGAAHAGWKGAFGGVLENTLAAMERLGAARSRIHVALGPMLGPLNYEVMTEFVQRFAQADSANARFFAPGQPGHAQFDLPAYIRARLLAAGAGHIEDTGLCTYADEARFYSYRRATHRAEPDYGRLMAAISLAE